MDRNYKLAENFLVEKYFYKVFTSEGACNISGAFLVISLFNK